MSDHNVAVVQLDLSDVEHRVGQVVGGGQLWDPCSATDIRRWVMAMDYPNPLHWNQEFAIASKYGGIIAPQSFVAGMDTGHGVQPACVGCIPDSHTIFGGEEWWFYGPRIRPGDRLFQERRFHDYRVANTRFAGPTMFSRGDTLHSNQNGMPIARERSTLIRFLPSEAVKLNKYENELPSIKRWTSAELENIDKIRTDWIMSGRQGTSPRFEAIEIGHKLPRRVIGPHSIATFTTEYRAFVSNAWGAYGWYSPPGLADPWVNQDAGWPKGFELDYAGADIDPRKADGLMAGPSRGHVDVSKAEQIGMARAYGYGATMGAWNTDYLAYWAGNDGMVRHSKATFKSPAFEGDVTFIDGEVIAKEAESTWGVPIVTVAVRMQNQAGVDVVVAKAEVELPY